MSTQIQITKRCIRFWKTEYIIDADYGSGNKFKATFIAEKGMSEQSINFLLTQIRKMLEYEAANESLKR